MAVENIQTRNFGIRKEDELKTQRLKRLAEFATNEEERLVLDKIAERAGKTVDRYTGSDGIERTIDEWMAITGRKRQTIYSRIRCGHYPDKLRPRAELEAMKGKKRSALPLEISAEEQAILDRIAARSRARASTGERVKGTDGRELTIREWAKDQKVSPQAIDNRVRNGHPPDAPRRRGRPRKVEAVQQQQTKEVTP